MTQKNTIAHVMSRFIPIPECGCLIWEGAEDSDGYGRTGFEGKTYSIHRFAWEREYGLIPKGMCILHSCDTPSCGNLKHLLIGTHQDNIADRQKKGRSSGGHTGPIKSGKGRVRKNG